MLQAFVITAREGVEAFLIIAITVAYLRKSGRPRLVRAVKWGVLTAVAVSVGAGILLEQAANHSLWEAILGTAAALMVGSLTVYMLRAGRRMRHDIETRLERRVGPGGEAGFLGVFAFTVFMMTREGMETALLFSTLLFQVRSAAAILGAVLGTGLAAAIAWLWSRYGHRVQLGRFLQVTAVFLLVFVVQLVVYSFHEFTEAGVLPHSEALHLATEPYGPDGTYGQYLSYLLVGLPLAWLAMTSFPRAGRGAPATRTNGPPRGA
jgi:high-affinity iron transporter